MIRLPPKKATPIQYGQPNDAGPSCTVYLIATFLHFFMRKPKGCSTSSWYTAEEEISGTNGIASIQVKTSGIAVGIIRDPTQMQMAIAERGRWSSMQWLGEGKVRRPATKGQRYLPGAAGYSMDKKGIRLSEKYHLP